MIIVILDNTVKTGRAYIRPKLGYLQVFHDFFRCVVWTSFTEIFEKECLTTHTDAMWLRFRIIWVLGLELRVVLDLRCWISCRPIRPWTNLSSAAPNSQSYVSGYKLS
jgi:hypothetical protein